jgi:transposase
LSVRKNKDTASKEVVLFLDNAVIHKHSAVLETARKFKVNVLFNAEYSPWLNPIEQLFGHLKKQLRGKTLATK